MMEPKAAAAREWDVIIIGTGVGGATLGHALALRGLSVLFLEKGGRVGPTDASNATATPESGMTQGWWPHPISHRQTNGVRRRFYAPIGCALGGSSIHYAAALERMPPSDFDSLAIPTGSISRWPVSFGEFAPFYDAAEELYGIRREAREISERRMSE
jgi:choline dehydrogenase-like flavoprotein